MGLIISYDQWKQYNFIWMQSAELCGKCSLSSQVIFSERKRQTRNILLLFTGEVVSDSLRPKDCSPSGSSLCPWAFLGKNTGVGCHLFSRGSSQPRNWTHDYYIDRQILYHWATWESHRMHYCVLKSSSCVRLWNGKGVSWHQDEWDS